MPPLNVLWVIDHVCYDGSLHGGGRLYWNLLPAFDPERVRVVPCLLRASDEIREVFAHSPVPVRILDKGKFDPTTLTTFLRLLRRERIDVMHLHCYGASTFGRVAGVLTGVPAIVQDYDTEVYFPYPRYLWLADVLLAGATAHALAASPMVRRFQATRRKIAPDRISTMFHALPADSFTPVAPERVGAVRARLGAGPGRPLVGTVTKLGPQRGNDVLVDAAARALREVPGALFLVAYRRTLFHRLPSKRYVPVSDAERETQVATLVEQARRLGIEEAIRFIEWPGAVSDFLAACDVMVAPFLSERFSSVNVLEALALGKPVVATDLGEQAEIIREGGNGFLVAAGDPAALADRVVTLLRDRDLRARLSHQAAEDAVQYGVQANARRLEALYLRLARRAA